MNYVIDASAVLAAMLDEPGGDIARNALAASLICSVNLAEVAACLRAEQNDEHAVRAIVSRIAIPVVPADAALAIDAGLMRHQTAHIGLSLGDRFCLALARRTGLKVLTADRIWTRVAQDLGLTIETIR